MIGVICSPGVVPLPAGLLCAVFFSSLGDHNPNVWLMWGGSSLLGSCKMSCPNEPWTRTKSPRLGRQTAEPRAPGLWLRPNVCFTKCFHSGGCDPKATPSSPALPVSGVVKRCIEERLLHLFGQRRGAGPGWYWAGLCGYSNQRQRCQPGLIHLWCSLMRKLVRLNRPLFPLSGAHW